MSEMMNESTVPREVRAELMDTVEEIGQALGLLREAATDADAGNVTGGMMSGSDALFILSELEGKFAAMCAKLARWSEGATKQAHPWAQLTKIMSEKLESKTPSDAAACSHFRRVPRDILVVLDQILEIIPLEEMEIRRSLDLHHSANRYRAPELQDWHGVAATLQLHCEGRSEQWIEESLAVWRDDANAGAVATGSAAPRAESPKRNNG